MKNDEREMMIMTNVLLINVLTILALGSPIEKEALATATRAIEQLEKLSPPNHGTVE